MDIIPVVGLGITAAAVALLLRGQNSPVAMAVSLAAAILIFIYVAQSIIPVFEQLNSLAGNAQISSEYLQILFKCLGLCVVTQLAADTCRDSGESAIASKIEMAGKAAVIISSLPMFSRIVSVAYTLANL